MIYQVALTDDAQADLAAIADFFIEAGEPTLATRIINQLSEAIVSLAEQPRRGHTPHELHGLGRVDELEIIVHDYRIIYLVRPQTVYVIAIFHSRQNAKEYLLLRNRPFISCA